MVYICSPIVVQEWLIVIVTAFKLVSVCRGAQNFPNCAWCIAESLHGWICVHLYGLIKHKTFRLLEQFYHKVTWLTSCASNED